MATMIDFVGITIDLDTASTAEALEARDNLIYESETSAFPGSKAWQRAQQATAFVNQIEAARADVREAIAARQAAKRKPLSDAQMWG